MKQEGSTPNYRSIASLAGAAGALKASRTPEEMRLVAREDGTSRLARHFGSVPSQAEPQRTELERERFGIGVVEEATEEDVTESTEALSSALKEEYMSLTDQQTLFPWRISEVKEVILPVDFITEELKLKAGDYVRIEATKEGLTFTPRPAENPAN